jgi:4-amino-4-deoxy-L-arabinose transferase-like glycosyltransferase
MSTTHSNSHHRWRWPIALFALTLLAFSLRWYYEITALVVSPVRGDATQYVAYAWNLVNHHAFAQNAPGSSTITPDNYRDPGYPFFLALLMKALGTQDAWYASVLLCQALLGALTVAMATQLGRYWLPWPWAIVAGVLMAVWPHDITINGYLLTETLFGFLCALGLLFFAKALRQPNTYRSLAAGVVLGAAALTNAVLIPFGVLLAAFLAWRKLSPRTVCAALAIGALLLPGAWAIRNTQLSPAISGRTSLDRALQNFAQGASLGFHKAYRDSFFGDATAKAEANVTLQAVNVDYALLIASPMQGAKAFLQKVSQQPLRYFYWYMLEKPHELWGWSIVVGQGDIYVYPTVNSPFKTNHGWIALEAICEALNPLLLFMAVASVYFAWSQHHFEKTFSFKPANRIVLIGVFSLVAFITAVYSALQAEPRYSIPFRPFEILLAITSLAGASRLWRARHRP